MGSWEALSQNLYVNKGCLWLSTHDMPSPVLTALCESPGAVLTMHL